MFKYLRILPGLAFVAGSVLYFFGFVSISAFLSCFGISSFEVVNARFIVAGIFPLISLIIAIYIVWQMQEKKIEYFEFLFNDEKRDSQTSSHIFILSLIFVVSLGLKMLFVLGKVATPQPTAQLIYNPISINYVGKLINAFIPNSNIFHFISYITKFSLSMFVNICIICLFIWGFLILFEKTIFAKIASFIKKEGEKTTEKVEKKKSVSNIIMSRCIAILFFSIEAGLFSYAYIKLSTSIYSFESFNRRDLSLGLVFSWLYISSIFLYIFAVLTEINLPEKKFDLKRIAFIMKENPYFLFQNGLIPIMTILIFFGQIILPRISYSIGGEEPREIIIKTKNDKMLCSYQNVKSKTYYIGESSSMIYIVISGEKANKAYQINRNDVLFVETKSSHDDSREEKEISSKPREPSQLIFNKLPNLPGSPEVQSQAPK